MEASGQRSGMMTRDEWKEWLAKSWDEAQARASTPEQKPVKEMTMIKTWQERCEEHPDHEGIVTERMIRNRMQEEIDELRQAIAEAEDALAAGREALFQAQNAAIGLTRQLEIYEAALEQIILCREDSLEATKAKQALAQVRGVVL